MKLWDKYIILWYKLVIENVFLSPEFIRKKLTDLTF
jgi:hypothetical protein